MTSTTTLKVPRALKARIARLAKQSGRSPHAFMLEALERQTCREEQIAVFGFRNEHWLTHFRGVRFQYSDTAEFLRLVAETT